MKSALAQLTRPWEIFLVPHTHVDIGYTEPQTLLFRKHAEFIARALDYCAATDAWPPGERFCWTCEVAWTIRQFLDRFPERTEEFFRRVREGRIEITGLYVQLTDLFGEALLEQALAYAEALARAHDVPVVTAMNDDVNGWAWGLPRLLAARGIRYFDTAINECRSLGVRPRPRPLYWAAPDGARVLLWHGEGYLHGNALGLDRPGAEERMADYLRRLETAGYPHSAIEIRIHGASHDNAPPGLWIADVVRAWNRRHANPKLRLCTARAWFEHLEAHWPAPIPELRAGWPDWWADGHGTALYESALVRKAQADLATADVLAAVGARLDAERLDHARDAALLFCEHTWGAWCSTDDPDALESRAQWNVKAGFAYTAAVEAQALVDEALRACAPPSGAQPEIAVFNPLPFERTDLAEVLVTDDLLGVETSWVAGPRRLTEGPAFHLVDLDTGESVPVARQPAIAHSARRPAQRVRFLVRRAPARGWRRYRVVPAPLASASDARAEEGALIGRWFQLRLDPRTGGMTSLIERSHRRELVNPAAYTLNQHIIETITSSAGREALCEWARVRRDTAFSRRTPDACFAPGAVLPFGATLLARSEGEDGHRFECEMVLYDKLPRVDIVNRLTRRPHPRAEAVYHAFPLAARQPTVYLDVPGATLRPGADQIPGTATDWHSLQHYFAVADADWTTVVASPDVPLVQVNGINTGQWQTALPPHNGTVMSWVMNNYWFTNFPAVQGGTVEYRYSIAAWPGAFDADAAARFAATVRQPLVALARTGSR